MKTDSRDCHAKKVSWKTNHKQCSLLKTNWGNYIAMATHKNVQICRLKCTFNGSHGPFSSKSSVLFLEAAYHSVLRTKALGQDKACQLSSHHLQQQTFQSLSSTKPDSSHTLSSTSKAWHKTSDAKRTCLQDGRQHSGKNCVINVIWCKERDVHRSIGKVLHVPIPTPD